ncbi:SGNH/GDSL hydrolase family protein [Streptomyces sp. NPDC048441]|uniref:SGNH/GDSL hydrolase family protein n=1 Tax=Streptomyces sp. NPDC048441 TaxID=3365552 RepID=UPI00370F7A2C
MRGRSRPAFAVLLAALFAAPALTGLQGHPATASPAAQPSSPHHWVGGWATALTPAGTTGPSAEGFSDRTLRQVVRVSAGGDRVRLRVSNAYGTRPLDIGAMSVARRAQGAATVPGTRHQVRFSGVESATLPPGADLISDPVSLPVPADSDLMVDLYLPTATGPATWHGWAKQTSYLSTPGDWTADEDGAAYPDRTTSSYYLQGVDVSSATARRTVVAFGDSITEGGATPDDANLRWPDILGRRLAGDAHGKRFSVVNDGIGGNRLLTDAGTASNGRVNLGLNAENRFTRDVLTQPAASDMIVLLGTNDLGADAGVRPGSKLTADQLIAGLAALAQRAHAMGIAVHGGTITPNGKLKPSAEAIREQANEWIRTGGAFDSVIDFDEALRDPADPHRLLPAYNSGDGVHPNADGMREMADTVDLSKLG